MCKVNAIKNRWYDLEYEDSETTRGNRTPIVLFTSKDGLCALANELQRLTELDEEGRHEVNIDGVDKIFDAPFTHVEIRAYPLETKKTDENIEWKRPLTYIGIGILAIGVLTMYGLARLIMDFVN